VNFDLPPSADIKAALARDDYAWLVENVFLPGLAQIMREEETAALLKSPRPRSRRLAGTGLRRHSHRQARRIPEVPG
jgi:hypothetical protein